MINKGIFLFFFLVCFAFSPLQAQDILETIDGETIELYVHKVKSQKLVYRLGESQKGPKLKKELSEISSISRQNGETLYFLEGERIPVRATEMFLKGRDDASVYYPGNATAEYLVLAGTSFQPLAGLLAAIFITQEPVMEHNLNYPDEAMMEEENYRIGYEDQAFKIKDRRVMNKWLIGFGVNMALTTMIIIL